MMTNEHIETVINKIHVTRLSQKRMPKISGVLPTISIRFVDKDLLLIEDALKMYLAERKGGNGNK